MRIISVLDQASERALETLWRFPVVLAAGAFVAIMIASEPNGGQAERLMMTALVSIIVAFDFTLLRERLELRRGLGDLLVLVGTLGVLALIHWSITLVSRFGSEPPYDTFIGDNEAIWLFAIAVGLHALAAVIPFVGRRRLHAFWQYNRQLFIRILSSALFSGVLYGGLAVALWAIDELLGAEVDDTIFLHLFGFMAGVVNTWFFLAGVPRVSGDVEESTEAAVPDEYPRGLKVFAQFVLLPLTVVYLVILYLYVGQIILTWNLPKGQVSYLIFSYAAIGTLAYLLIYPLRDDDENRWIRTYAKGFFTALAPLLVVLVIALLRRTGEYGLTEARYYGVGLAAWLAIIVAYFLSGREDIRFIPMSLAVVAILGSVGPWSASSVAVRSQLSELSRLAAARPLDEEAQRRVSSIGYFLFNRGRLADAAALASARPDTVSDVTELERLFGVQTPNVDIVEPTRVPVGSLTFDLPEVVDVEGFSEIIDVRGDIGETLIRSPRFGNVVVRGVEADSIRVETSYGQIVLRVDSLVRETTARLHDLPRESPAIAGAGPNGLRARLLLTSMTIDGNPDSVQYLSSLRGRLLLGGR